MDFFGIGREEETLESLQEEQERLQVRERNRKLQVSIAEQEAMLKKIREAGLSRSDFGNSWERIRAWIRGH